MPKEIVRGEQTVDEGTGLPTPDDLLSFVHVGWDRDRYVQIATVEPKGRLAYFYPEDAVDAVGGGKWVVDNSGTPGWFVTLDREAINDLIRNLRKARDQAFGRDE